VTDVKKTLWSLLLVFFTFSVSAAEDVVSELSNSIQPFISKISLIVGGIFGVYFILLVIRIWYERKKVKILQDIRYDLDRFNQSQGIAHSQQRKAALSRFMKKIRETLAFHHENRAIQKRYRQRKK